MAMISQGDFVIMTFDQMDEFDGFNRFNADFLTTVGNNR